MGLRLRWLKCRDLLLKLRDLGRSVQVKESREPVVGGRGSGLQVRAPGSRHCMARIRRLRFLDIQNPVAERGDPGLEAWGSGIRQWGWGSRIRGCTRALDLGSGGGALGASLWGSRLLWWESQGWLSGGGSSG